MSLDTTIINRSIRELIRTILGMPLNSVRPANQSAPAEKAGESFATVQILSIAAIGIDRVLIENEPTPSLNVQETIEGLRRCVVSVQFFRGDAYSRAARLHALLRSSQASEFMQQKGIGLIKANEAQDITAVSSTSYESRAAIKVEFYVASDEVLSVATYGRFPVSVDTAVKKPDGSFYPPQTIEVIAP
jgi:hypothetical protein